MGLGTQANLFDQVEKTVRCVVRDALASKTLEASVTLSLVQLEALLEPLVQRAVERVLTERAVDLPGVSSHVSVAVAARLLGMAPKTIANMLSDGRLTRYGAPRRPLVALEEIEAITHRRGREGAPLAAVRRRPGQRQPGAASFVARAKAG
jgi:hypothetical protein